MHCTEKPHPPSPPPWLQCKSPPSKFPLPSLTDYQLNDLAFLSLVHTTITLNK